MASESHFQLLNSEEVRLIASSVTLRAAYVDFLAMLQGTVAPFGAHRGISMFTDFELIKDSLNASLAEFPPTVAAKMRTNRDTAFELRRENIDPETTQTTLGLAKRVDDFLQGLIAQYEILRSAASESESKPRVMEATW